MSRPLHSAVALAVCLSMTPPLAAQLRESIDVRVLELEATVLDRAGRPVEGLKSDDFQVRIGKHDIPITNFFAVRNGAIVPDEKGAPAPDTPVATETSIPTTLVIFIDDVHLGQRSHGRAIDALKRYVSANVGTNMTATLIRYNRHMDVLTRPTERPGYILAELEKLRSQASADELVRERNQIIAQIDDVLSENPKGRGPGGESPDSMFYRLSEYAEKRVADVDRTIEALENAIRLSSAFSGRKVLLYVSDGLPQTSGLEVFEYWDRALLKKGIPAQAGGLRSDAGTAARFDRSAAFERLSQTAQRADVAIFSFDAGGLRGEEGRSVEFASTLGSLNTLSLQANMRSGLQYIAEETGGRYVSNENNIDKVLTQMSEQFTSYYSIGIRPQRGEIRVTVKNHPEYHVIASKRMPPQTREDKLQQTLRSRLYTRTMENPLDATLHVGAAKRVNNDCVVPVRLSVPQPQLPAEMTPQNVDIRMIMLNERNDESAMQTLTLPFESGRAQHTLSLRVRPEHQVLSVAISNPLSGESSFLQGDIDGSVCK